MFPLGSGCGNKRSLATECKNKTKLEAQHKSSCCHAPVICSMYNTSLILLKSKTVLNCEKLNFVKQKRAEHEIFLKGISWIIKKQNAG